MGKNLFRIGLGILVFLAVTAIFSVVAMLLWNWLMPNIFGLPLLNYWQTLGIVILFRILFGSIGLGNFNRRGQGFRSDNALREKWENMSDKERKEFFDKENNFRNLFRERFSFR